jgi:acyl-CoA thioesterase
VSAPAGETPTGSFPLRTHLGMDVESSAGGGGEARLHVDGRHLNPNGVVHGAVLFAMVDTAMGAAAMGAVPAGNLCASIEVHLRFLRPVTGGDLRAAVEVERAGRRVIHLSWRVVDGDDVLVATATGTFAVLPPPAG